MAKSGVHLAKSGCVFETKIRPCWMVRLPYGPVSGRPPFPRPCVCEASLPTALCLGGLPSHGPVSGMPPFPRPCDWEASLPTALSMGSLPSHGPVSGRPPFPGRTLLLSPGRRILMEEEVITPPRGWGEGGGDVGVRPLSLRAHHVGYEPNLNISLMIFRRTVYEMAVCIKNILDRRWIYWVWYCYVGGDIYLCLIDMLLVGMLWVDVLSVMLAHGVMCDVRYTRQKEAL